MPQLTEPRITALTSIPLADPVKAAEALRAERVTAEEFGPVFARLSATDATGAARFSGGRSRVS